MTDVQAPVERALVVVAHPDDLDFGAAGTIATWTDAGIEVSYCICTDGDAGGFDPDVPRSEIGGIRQAEQRAAAKELGVEDVVFLGYPDGRLTASIELRRDISRVIRQRRPQRLMMQSPERNWERIYSSHPDHLAAEGLEAWTVEQVWVMAGGGGPANHYVDVTDTFERKLSALRAHVSQTGHLGAELETMLRGWSTTMATAAGWPEGRLAEAFTVVPTV